MKKVLLEFLATSPKKLEILNEGTKDEIIRCEVKWQHIDKVNANGRLYRKSLVQREIEKLQPAMTRGAVFGASYHPKGDAEVDDVSHIWESVKIDDDGGCTGIVKILPTDRGRNAQVIIKHGGQIGLSSRGTGTTTSKEVEAKDGIKSKYDEVNDDYVLRSPGDFVLSPSVPDAGVQKIIEGRYNESDTSKSKLEEDDKMEIKTIDELRSSYPDLVKTLDEKIATLETENKTIKEDIEALLEDFDVLVEVYNETLDDVRAAILYLSDVPGVIPEETEDVEGDEDVEEEPEEKDDEEEKDEEVKPQEKKDVKEEHPPRPDDNPEKKKVEDELKKALDAKDAEIKVLKEEKEARDAKEASDKAAKAIVDAKRNEIIKGDLTEKGKIEDPEGKSNLTEDNLHSRWQNALKAGYQGSFEKYKEIFLKK